MQWVIWVLRWNNTFTKIAVLVLCWIGLANAYAYPLGSQSVSIPSNATVRADLLKQITPLVNSGITANHFPGAVVLVSHRGKIIYRGVFGSRQIKPSLEPMTFDTIFDIASLTKVIATLPAVMQLLEQGKVTLDEKVGDIWPAFNANNKSEITLRELLTHTSGLEADIDMARQDPEAVYRAIVNAKPEAEPGTTFIYSDLNFIVLAHLVELITHESFQAYTQKHVFDVLGMKDTHFIPAAKVLNRVAPTQERLGVVNDPMAYAMGGVSGNAGLFSTAGDLAKFADMMLNGGRIEMSPTYLLGPLTVLKMMSVETPSGMADQRGLGWDVDSRFTARGDLLPLPSYGHTGWTGTSIWVDPNTDTWIIILTSRTHPSTPDANYLVEYRKKIANIVAGSLTDVAFRGLKNVGVGEMERAYPHPQSTGWLKGLFIMEN